MDLNIVFSYDYSSRNRRRRRTNVPPSRAILMAMAMSRCRCDTERIARCSMTRASPEATECRHQATNRSVSPRRPPGRQSLWTRTHFVGHFDGHRDAAVLYPRIPRLRRFVTFIKATKRHHRTSTCSDSINRSMQCRLFLRFHHEKGLELTLAPNITIGVWHINLKGRTWRMEWNTYMGVLN
jgi:hypothetical protein